MSKPQKVLRYNVLTALGALCLDEDVRTPYFKGVPAGALMHQHGIPITDDEVADVSQMLPLTHSPTADDVAILSICPKKPCLYATPDIETMVAAGVMDDAFRALMFESSDPNFDPTLIAYQYGLTLSPDEHILLKYLLANKKTQKEISDSMKKLGKKIKDQCPTDFILKKKIELTLKAKEIAQAA
ncbi:MAG: hypothetical protein ACM3QS_17060 [Bacteroidota bacterium]